VGLERVPDLFEIQAALPTSLETAFPALAVLWGAMVFTLTVSAVAATVALSSRESVFRRRSGQMLALVAVILACIPTSFHSGAEVFAITVSGVLTATWLLVAAVFLLRDHAAAWIFFGAFASGVPAALRLLSEPATADRIAGASALVLLAVALAALLGSTTRHPAVEPSPPSGAKPLPLEVP